MQVSNTDGVHDLKFVMSEMTALKFFVPLIEEGNRRGIDSTVFFGRSNKYSNTLQHIESLKQISEKYRFEIVDLSKNNNADGDVLFTVEGAWRDLISNKRTTVSLYCSSDFTASYDKYVNEVDHVVLGSKFVADFYGKKSDKNSYLGSPKFDVSLDRDTILEKYKLCASKKRVTIFYPRLRDIASSRVEDVIKAFHNMRYDVILKTRGKDPFVPGHEKLVENSMYDRSWYPSTSMELISVSDLIFNFSSTVIEETTALRKPVINFHVKPFLPSFNFLYECDFVRNVRDIHDLPDHIEHFENYVPTNFEEANSKLFDTKSSSRSILDMLL